MSFFVRDITIVQFDNNDILLWEDRERDLFFVLVNESSVVNYSSEQMKSIYGYRNKLNLRS